MSVDVKAHNYNSKWHWNASGTRTHTAAAFRVQIAETVEALLAARTVLQVAFAAGRQHAFGHHRGAHLLVAGAGRRHNQTDGDQHTDDERSGGNGNEAGGSIE